MFRVINISCLFVLCSSLLFTQEHDHSSFDTQREFEQILFPKTYINGSFATLSPQSVVVSAFQPITILMAAPQQLSKYDSLVLVVPDRWGVPNISDNSKENYVEITGMDDVSFEKTFRNIPGRIFRYYITFKIERGFIDIGDSIKIILGAQKQLPYGYQAINKSGIDTFFVIVNNHSVQSIPIIVEPDQPTSFAFNTRMNTIVGERRVVTAAMFDRYGNLANLGATVKISSTDSLAEFPSQIIIAEKDSGAVNFNVTFNSIGTLHLKGEFTLINEKKYTINSHAIVSDSLKSLNKVFWGDLHVHTGLSLDGAGTLEELFYETKKARTLDFLAITDHNITIGLDWEQLYKKSIDATDDRFVFLPGFEFTSPDGHASVYGFESNSILLKEAAVKKNYSQLWSILSKSNYIAHINHPDSRTCTGFDFNQIDTSIIKNIEISNSICAATSEYYGNDSVYTPKQLEHQSVQDVLRLFYLGFIGGGDFHTVRPGIRARTGVIVDTLSPQKIINALRSRRTMVSSDRRIYSLIEINGKYINGDIITISESKNSYGVSLRIKAAAASKMKSVTVVKNGIDLLTMNPNVLSIDTTITDIATFDDANRNYYYLRVITEEGTRGWASPIWVVQNRIAVSRQTDSSPENYSVAIYPNPVNGRFILNISIPQQEHIMVRFYNSIGQLVSSQDYGTVPQGVHSFPVVLDNISSQLLFVKTEVGNTTYFNKLVFIK